MKHVYINGDSHSAGVSLESDSMSFGSLIAKEFDLLPVNQSLPGGSNQRAIRITQDWIRTSQDQYFILIGWTSWEREEWPWRGDFFQVNGSADTQGDTELHQKYQQWVTDLSEATIPNLGREWHENIWQFHTKLQDKNIPHLFFNCFYDFFVESTHHRDWNHCFFHPYDNDHSYWHYLKLHGYQTISDTDLHFGPDGHRAWADVLIAHIKENQLL